MLKVRPAGVLGDPPLVLWIKLLLLSFHPPSLLQGICATQLRGLDLKNGAFECCCSGRPVGAFGD